MRSIPILLAATIALALPGAVRAQSLTPEQAVGYLTIGIEVGSMAALSDYQFVWEQPSPQTFTGTGAGAQGQLQVEVSVVPRTDCIYDIRTFATIDGSTIYDEQGSYDFSNITGMSLTSPNTARISGQNYCTATDPAICQADIQLGVATTSAAFDKVYSDFRRDVCN